MRGPRKVQRMNKQMVFCHGVAGHLPSLSCTCCPAHGTRRKAPPPHPTHLVHPLPPMPSPFPPSKLLLCTQFNSRKSSRLPSQTKPRHPPATAVLHSLVFCSFSSMQVTPPHIAISSQPTGSPLHTSNSLGARTGPDSGSEQMPCTRVLDLNFC